MMLTMLLLCYLPDALLLPAGVCHLHVEHY
jgi:hypothetical protein